jgi:hypothetical protein
VCSKEYHPCYKYQRFCSYKCAYIGRTVVRHKKHGPRAKRDRCKCLGCGKVFHLLASRVKVGWGKYCSKKCYNSHKKLTFLGKSNPNWKGGISMITKTYRGQGNKLYRKGKRYERLTRKSLEEKGFYVINSAGSKGPFDLVAIKETEMIMIQVKSNQNITPKERREMAAVPIPPIGRKEIWLYVGNVNRLIRLVWNGTNWINRENNNQAHFS